MGWMEEAKLGQGLWLGVEGNCLSEWYGRARPLRFEKKGWREHDRRLQERIAPRSRC
jgi:hypothetical protein